MSQVLLVNPWIYDFAAFDLWQKPLGLLYIGAVLRNQGHKVTLLDCLDRYHPVLRAYYGKGNVPGDRKFGTGKYIRTEVHKPEVLRKVKRKYCRYGLPLSLVRTWLTEHRRPDLVMVTSGMTYWYLGVRHIIKEIRRQYPGVPVVLGGIYATLCPDHAEELSDAVRIVSGESEPYIGEIVREWISDGEEGCGTLRDLDSRPFPALDLYPVLKSIPILTSRGCPLSCSFCASGLVSGRFRQRSPSAVIEELCYWWKKVRIPDVAFFDDALFINSGKHFLPIMEGIIRAGFPFRFHTPNGLSPAFIDRDVASYMKKGGFTTIRLSLETISPELQAEISRKVSADDFSCAVDALDKAGFERNRIGAYILMGLPGQSVEEVLSAIRFAAQLGVRIKLAQFSPIPGTPAWQKALEENTITPDTDLLFTNNTLLPLRSAVFNWEAVQWIKDIVRSINGIIDADYHEVNRVFGRYWKEWEDRIIEYSAH